MNKWLAVSAVVLLALGFGVFASDHEEVERVEGGLVAVDLQDAIDYLYDNGLTMFATQETFMGEQSLRRDEAAAFFARFVRDVLETEVDETALGCEFSDLSNAHQDLLGEIEAACQLGLMRGHEGEFMPTDTLSNAQAMTVLVRLLVGDQEEPEDSWAANYAAVAKQAGLTVSLAADSVANLYAVITRADVAKMIEAAAFFLATDAGPTMNIVELAMAEPNLSTLVELLVAADLAAPLTTVGPFTVFAPVNEAFAALDEEAVAFLTSEEGLDDLAAVLTYHVIQDEIMAADIRDGDTAMTLNGQVLTFSVDTSGTVYVNGIAVIAADIQATNGVVHLIDFPIVPEEEE